MIMSEELDDYSPEINDWKNYVLKNGVSGIFGAYPKIVGREFQRSNVKTNDSAAAKRYFFFQRTWPKYLKNWKLEDDKANGIYSYKFVRK
jgi:muramidase (phage lysozyme)